MKRDDVFFGVTLGLALLGIVGLTTAGASVGAGSNRSTAEQVENAAGALVLHADTFARERGLDRSAVIHCALAKAETGYCEIAELMGPKQ